MPRIFIDGAYGTVGLALKERLASLVDAGLEVIEIPEDDRRNRTVRGDAYADADLVVLCVPDEEASYAAVRVDRANHRAKILDASAAHRCNPDWVYGLPQLCGAARIAGAKMVANPGCFASACILAARPLGLRAMDFHGITGFSAGGTRADAVPRLTQFGKEHRHLPEIRQFGLPDPTLTTSVGPWYQGMLVQATVDLPIEAVYDRYQTSYEEDPEIQVSIVGPDDKARLPIEACNGTNGLQIHLAALPGTRRTAVAVVLDNLGKGSAGAAAKNIALMLGL
ncbi:N-acetyl-gamma-glutamyl-phosphate reductase [Achromobacter anxifer]|uniref:hypothetical protein n=1 Tax=Achromobacter anxifer TaxID=1287737 RepID=UPI00155C38C2|nr:hypothetical protein [Achromobacter anxifer]CAB5514399.1 N-acetyl-gamma-glutamyl-phosphate reductase [Achromobacter anxifer]